MKARKSAEIGLSGFCLITLDRHDMKVYVSMIPHRPFQETVLEPKDTYVQYNLTGIKIFRRYTAPSLNEDGAVYRVEGALCN